jgi:hypothetical protein
VNVEHSLANFILDTSLKPLSRPLGHRLIHRIFTSEYTMGTPGMRLHPQPLSEERVRNQVSSALVGKIISKKTCIGPVIFHNNVLGTYRLEISRAHPQVLRSDYWTPLQMGLSSEDGLTKEGGTFG